LPGHSSYRRRKHAHPAGEQQLTAAAPTCAGLRSEGSLSPAFYAARAASFRRQFSASRPVRATAMRKQMLAGESYLPVSQHGRPKQRCQHSQQSRLRSQATQRAGRERSNLAEPSRDTQVQRARSHVRFTRSSSASAVKALQMHMRARISHPKGA
jgi:hypothetical protein